MAALAREGAGVTLSVSAFRTKIRRNLAGKRIPPLIATSFVLQRVTHFVTHWRLGVVSLGRILGAALIAFTPICPLATNASWAYVDIRSLYLTPALRRGFEAARGNLWNLSSGVMGRAARHGWGM